MKTEEHELKRIKKTKFVEMYYNTDERTLMMLVSKKLSEDLDSATWVNIPINKIPQVIRGLFSCYQRFNRR